VQFAVRARHTPYSGYTDLASAILSVALARMHGRSHPRNAEQGNSAPFPVPYCTRTSGSGRPGLLLAPRAAAILVARAPGVARIFAEPAGRGLLVRARANEAGEASDYTTKNEPYHQSSLHPSRPPGRSCSNSEVSCACRGVPRVRALPGANDPVACNDEGLTPQGLAVCARCRSSRAHARG